jgi:bifunctional UDP-N-acetylglucosamine pyrophosphorylase/glucosamine-1-phosphate N-acetyltransferase
MSVAASVADSASPANTAALTAIVLAAGEGTRMKSSRPKVVHEVLGRPMVSWVVEAAREAGATRIVVVVGNGADQVRALFADDPSVECVEQAERLGTGHAVQTVLAATGPLAGPVLVLCGDTPLLRASTLANLVQQASSAAGGALLAMEYADPTGYGRVMCDASGLAERIVEQKDCTPAEAAVTTCNAGVYCFDGAALTAHLGELGCNNVQHEYYLTDMVALLRAAGLPMRAVLLDRDPAELMGVNSRVQLAAATKAMQRRINEGLMLSGVTMLDPDQVWVGPGVTVGRDTELLPGTMLWGTTSVGEGCVVGPLSRLTNTQVGDGCIIDETVAVGAVIGNDVSCGPRAYLREGTVLMDGSKAGTHVELKKSTVGPGSKVPHLSYLGDCTVGADVNIGAGTITCNYDGKYKHPTTIGDGAFIGSDTMLVAPVNVGAGATVGAGSTITEDVPGGDVLALERSEQRIRLGWKPTWAREAEAGDAAGTF